LTLAETLEAYTRNGAWVEFMEDRKGVLKPGYLADIVVLDNDIELVSSEAIGEIKPVLTICDGKISYQA
jgi:predicted amidohydrolase YtcJ